MIPDLTNIEATLPLPDGREIISLWSVWFDTVIHSGEVEIYDLQCTDAKLYDEDGELLAEYSQFSQELKHMVDSITPRGRTAWANAVLDAVEAAWKNYLADEAERRAEEKWDSKQGF